jgi:hypothetical protein
MGNFFVEKSQESKEKADKFEEFLPYLRTLITSCDQNSKEATIRHLITKVNFNFI